MAGGDGATVDAAGLERWLRAFAAAVTEQEDALTELDAAIGDADHGANLHRGMAAVVAGLDGGATDDPAALLKQAGATIVRTVGGASGPLYGTFFLRMASGTGGGSTLDAPAFAAALRAGVEGLAARGKAEPGDKTMVDALRPAADALDAAVAAGEPLAAGLRAAADAAATGRDATTPWVARKGRASYLGERSAGHQDPGATSAAMLLATAADTLGAGGDG